MRIETKFNKGDNVVCNILSGLRTEKVVGISIDFSVHKIQPEIKYYLQPSAYTLTENQIFHTVAEYRAARIEEVMKNAIKIIGEVQVSGAALEAAMNSKEDAQ